MLVCAKYESLEQEEDDTETLILSKQVLQEFINEQNMLEKEKGGIVIN